MHSKQQIKLLNNGNDNIIIMRCDHGNKHSVGDGATCAFPNK